LQVVVGHALQHHAPVGDVEQVVRALLIDKPHGQPDPRFERLRQVGCQHGLVPQACLREAIVVAVAPHDHPIIRVLSCLRFEGHVRWWDVGEHHPFLDPLVAVPAVRERLRLHACHVACHLLPNAVPMTKPMTFITMHKTITINQKINCCFVIVAPFD
jgi:hypothetical protein